MATRDRNSVAGGGKKPAAPSTSAALRQRRPKAPVDLGGRPRGSGKPKPAAPPSWSWTWRPALPDDDVEQRIGATGPWPTETLRKTGSRQPHI
jgi:hypothetical protein